MSALNLLMGDSLPSVINSVEKPNIHTHIYILWADQEKEEDQTLLAKNLHSDEQNADNNPR